MSCACSGSCNCGSPSNSNAKNAPGLPALRYRAGTQPTFRTAMLDEISSSPSLSQLTTRSEDDPTVALIDSWASTLDILTFYQERIANEGFLRTATERRSILELSRAIGYELNPGVAASTYLSFTLDKTPGEIMLDAGIKAGSVPGPKQMPQTFETTEDLDARPEWNLLYPRQEKPFALAVSTTTVYLRGINLNLKQGDPLVFVGDERKFDFFFTPDQWFLGTVSSVAVDSKAGITVVELLSAPNDPIRVPLKNLKCYALRQKANLFGYNAPDPFLLVPTPKNVTGTDWKGMDVDSIAFTVSSPGLGTGLRGAYNKDVKDDQPALFQIDKQIDFGLAGSPAFPLSGPFAFAEWDGRLEIEVSGVYIFHVEAGGPASLAIGELTPINTVGTNAATNQASGLINMQQGIYDVLLFYSNPPGNSYQGAPYIRLQYEGPLFGRVDIPTSKLYPNTHVLYLDTVYPAILPDSWIVTEGRDGAQLSRVESTGQDSRNMFTLHSRVTRLLVDGYNPNASITGRETSVYAQSERLDLAGQPLGDPVAGLSIELAGRIEGFQAGRALAVSGLDSVTGQAASEIALLFGVDNSGANTILNLTNGLKNSYRRDSVTINANVARSTHGETRNEILGSGDASVPLQEFTLKQSPLTYVTAATASGAADTLEVRADGLLWTETHSLFEAGPAERVYTIRADANGNSIVQFGDGIHGSRLPTGSANVTATYRSGLGAAGLVNAGQISLLLSRPLGLKAVVNPLAPTGAADPESRDEARRNAPLTVLTLDRIVSVQDYEDFARAFAGIGKAQARVLRDGEHTFVHVTIASSSGGGVAETDPLFINLSAAIHKFQDPTARVRIQSFEQLLFAVSASVLIDTPTYLAADVLAAAKAALITVFSFENRPFAGFIVQNEVTAAIQNVPGVIAVQLTLFDLTGQTQLRDGLLALPAGFTFDANVLSTPKAAQMLTIDPTAIILTEMKS